MLVLKHVFACGFLTLMVSCASVPNSSNGPTQAGERLGQSEEEKKDDEKNSKPAYQFTRAYYDRF